MSLQLFAQTRNKTQKGAAASAVLLLLWSLWRRRARRLTGQVALVTGGSRGLGLLLAREFARQGCRVVICARDEAELERARMALAEKGVEVLAVPCDVARQEQVVQMIEAATDYFGRIDIVVNNAGVIQVGPLQTMRLQDFEEALDVMLWPILYTTQAVLPQMRRRRYGRIVNITSIGGRVSVPHLLPYNSAKFAAVGLSEGLRAELAGQGITVTTIVPGLMRTGSYLNASFKGHQEAEFTWFSLASSLPGITMDAAKAARQIVMAVRRGQAERTLTLPALLLARFHGLFPGPAAALMGAATRLVLPQAGGAGPERKRGAAVQARLSPPLKGLHNFLTTLGRRAAWRLNQYPGPLSVPVDIETAPEWQVEVE